MTIRVPKYHNAQTVPGIINAELAGKKKKRQLIHKSAQTVPMKHNLSALMNSFFEVCSFEAAVCSSLSSDTRTPQEQSCLITAHAVSHMDKSLYFTG